MIKYAAFAYKARATAATKRLEETNSHEKVRLTHLDRFFKHPSKEILVPFFPNAKEVTESFGAFHAVNEHLSHLSRDDINVAVICVGDGHSPRTGMLFAVCTCEVFSTGGTH